VIFSSVIAILESAKLTFEDYLLFAEDGKRHEFINGEHHVPPEHPASVDPVESLHRPRALS
jgi:hypothetical protein